MRSERKIINKTQRTETDETGNDENENGNEKGNSRKQTTVKTMAIVKNR